MGSTRGLFRRGQLTGTGRGASPRLRRANDASPTPRADRGRADRQGRAMPSCGDASSQTSPWSCGSTRAMSRSNQGQHGAPRHGSVGRCGGAGRDRCRLLPVPRHGDPRAPVIGPRPSRYGGRGHRTGHREVTVESAQCAARSPPPCSDIGVNGCRPMSCGHQAARRLVTFGEHCQRPQWPLPRFITPSS